MIYAHICIGLIFSPMNNFCKRLIRMEKLAISLLVLLLTAGALPVYADDPAKTPEECKKIFEGDDAKIRACLESTLHRTVILSTADDEAKIKACLEQLEK